MDKSHKPDVDSAETKVKAWAEANRHTLLFYDVIKSFGPSTVPDSQRRIVKPGRRADEALGTSTWQAGKEAIDFLQKMLPAPRGDATTLEDLNEVLPDLFAHAEEFLDTNVYPDLIQAIDQGLIHVKLPPGEFKNYWSESRMAEKARMFLDILCANVELLRDSGFEQLPQKIAALAVLQKIDDCMLESFEPSTGLGEAAIEIERLRSIISLAPQPTPDASSEQWSVKPLQRVKDAVTYAVNQTLLAAKNAGEPRPPTARKMLQIWAEKKPNGIFEVVLPSEVKFIDEKGDLRVVSASEIKDRIKRAVTRRGLKGAIRARAGR